MLVIWDLLLRGDGHRLRNLRPSFSFQSHVKLTNAEKLLIFELMERYWERKRVPVSSWLQRILLASPHSPKKGTLLMTSLHSICNYISTHNKLTPRWPCLLGREFRPWEKSRAEVDKPGRGSPMFCLARIITSLELEINFLLAVIGSDNWAVLHSRSVSFPSLPIPTPVVIPFPSLCALHGLRARLGLQATS